MINHRGIRISSILSLIIISSIPFVKSAPTLTKSLAPIWLPNDSTDNNQHGNSGLWSTKLSDTTVNPDTKSDAPVIRHISTIPTKKESYYPREWSGSLPFSILYVNTQPHSRSAFRAKSNANNSRSAQRPTESSPTKQPSARPTTRSRNGRHSRTQYSIIPELFMSYGWSGWGK